jgi:hypothetical protein
MEAFFCLNALSPKTTSLLCLGEESKIKKKAKINTASTNTITKKIQIPALPFFDNLAKLFFNIIYCLIFR